MSINQWSICTPPTHKITWELWVVCVCVCVCVFVRAQSCLTHWDPMDCTAGLLCPWNFLGKNTGVVAITYSRESSQPRDQTWVSVSCIGRWILYQLCHLEVGRCFSSPFSKLSSKLLLWFIQSLYYLKFWTYLMKHSSKGKWFSPARLIQRKGVI